MNKLKRRWGGEGSFLALHKEKQHGVSVLQESRRKHAGKERLVTEGAWQGYGYHLKSAGSRWRDMIKDHRKNNLKINP